MTQVNEPKEKTLESETPPKKKPSESKIQALKRLLGFSERSSLNETDISIAHYQTILKEKPNDKMAWMYLGGAFQKKFQFEKAIECKLMASNISPNDPEVKFSLGCSYCAKGDFSAAIKSYLDALEFKPNYAEACEALADQYLIIGQEGKAEEWLDKAQKIKLAQPKIM